ncbi:probable receptor-like protein kinase At5g24010 [Mangifera indica]|uniref:probable receptor-like protein kinase At5g24010 n=1 Tax=Mangifera indica TaxID=29780 RepID=UPI001CFA71C8|nr:probable receptor-like protein kinase At5g24010 [Mangifera indica]
MLMEIFHNTHSSFFLLFFFLSYLCAFSFSLSFSPIDNYLIDCGSAVDAIIDNRRFVPDSFRSNSPLFSSSTRSVQLNGPGSSLPQIYNSARVFDRPSKYVFKIRDQGTHMVRLHFHQLNSSEIDFADVKFHVLVNGYVVLSNFSGGHNLLSPRVKEYLIFVHDEQLVIKFLPARKSKLAFVNAIEVISAPKDLILDTAQFVNWDKIEKFDGLSRQALEVMHRVNVGGSKVTPFNDTLWRTWLPDDEFLKSGDGLKRVYFSGRIRYQRGGPSREVGPDNVYNTARVIVSTNASIPNLNMTWEFPVVENYKYLVRLHFCDIASISVGLLFFNVYVNGNLAYKDLDLSYLTAYTLASPFYMDFVVDVDHSGVLSVSVGPSEKSLDHAVDGILNAVEIMKLNKSMGILDGEHCAGLILNSWPRGNTGILVPLVAAVCMILSLSAFMHKRRNGVKNSMGWHKLPTDVPEMNPKHGNQHISVEM